MKKKIFSILMTITVLMVITAVSYASPPAASNNTAIAAENNFIRDGQAVATTPIEVAENANYIAINGQESLIVSNIENTTMAGSPGNRKTVPIAGNETGLNYAANTKAQSAEAKSSQTANNTKNSTAGVNIDGSMVQIK